MPAKEVRLPDTEEASGTIVLEFASPVGGDLPSVWMPDAIEVTAADEHLLDGLRAGRGADRA